MTEPTAKHREEAREPCPFCGDTLIEITGNEWEEDLRARCIGCLASSGRYRTRTEALAAWNTRTLLTTNIEVREILERLRIYSDPDPCWCGAGPLKNDNHDADCLAARGLWERV